MIHWAKVKRASGEIVAMGGCESAYFQGILDKEDALHDVFLNRPIDVRRGTHFFDYATSEWTACPAVPIISSTYDLTALPPGTVVRVVDESGAQQEVVDLSDVLILVGPQTYVVSVEPPFPFAPVRARLEVS